MQSARLFAILATSLQKQFSQCVPVCYLFLSLVGMGCGANRSNETDVLTSLKGAYFEGELFHVDSQGIPIFPGRSTYVSIEFSGGVRRLAINIDDATDASLWDTPLAYQNHGKFIRLDLLPDTIIEFEGNDWQVIKLSQGGRGVRSIGTLFRVSNPHQKDLFERGFEKFIDQHVANPATP